MVRKVILFCGLFLALSVPAMAQNKPDVEVFGGYSHLDLLGVGNFGFNGGSGSVSVNMSKWFGLVGDFGGYHTSAFGSSATAISYMGGPKFSYRKMERITPFAQALFGGMHLTQSVGGICNGGSGCKANPFAMAMGGGLDVNLTPHLGIRLVQAEYLYTRFGGEGIATSQNGLRVSAGIVFRWGGKS
jgi:opacity protein-like surface antigen